MRYITAWAASILIATTALADDTPNTILVLDGSGSMWGQIDGVAKITIAQDVINTLLDDFPTDQGIGLTVYGHRERGNCTDIETIVAPTTGANDAVAAAVSNISPLGKTPMTDAVIMAAQALRYTEDSATVILVSDGVETCHPDPCAAARLLEDSGIDFTAHVIGFDVGSDPDALAQMQCIAEETGGLFLTADTADQLSQALTSVAAAPPAPEPEPLLVSVILTAVEGQDGPVITDPVLWTIRASGEDVFADETGNPLDVTLQEGSYVATAYRVSDETALEQQFVAIGENADVTITFPQAVEVAKLIAPETAPLGSDIQVGWDGPDGENDYITVSAPDEPGYINYTYTREGRSLNLTMPPRAGTFELRYVSEPDANVIATTIIEVLPVEVSLDAADTVEKGAELAVTWIGPDYDSDYISVGRLGEAAYINYTYTNEGTPLNLTMPTEVGDYEIRYQLRQGDVILATRPITVTDLQVGLTAPETATAGEHVTVQWTGPDYDNDYISVGIPGDANYINYTYTSEGNPVSLQMPTEPGDYELRYQLRQDDEIIATRPITTTKIDVSLSTPSSAAMGEYVSIEWTGPDYEGDYISVGEVGQDAYINYTYTSDGAPLVLQMPTEVGDFEVRYQLRQDSVILRREPISITALKVQLLAEPTAKTGEQLLVGWDGPDYPNDYIAISSVGDSGYVTYANTSGGNPVSIRVPDQAGDYELRYVLRQGSTVVYSQPLTITD